MRSVGRVAAVTVLLLAILAPPAEATPAACEDIQLPVAVLGQNLHEHGRLCSPAAGAGTVIMLVAGGSYNSTYWDFPYQPDTYNFRQAMNRAGYATFTVDRLGTGQSSKPLSATLTATTQAEALHQMMPWLRARFGKIVLGGHSIGSMVVMWEASLYHDVDSVLLTGISHHPNLVNLTLLLADLRPAVLDPKFANEALDPGYLTTAPGSRQGHFYEPGDYDPAVVAADESTKDADGPLQLADGFLAMTFPLTVDIQVPVLLVNGDGDKIMCGLLAADCRTAATLGAGEASYFAPQAQLRTFVVANSGHDVNLTRGTVTYQREVLQWMQAIGLTP